MTRKRHESLQQWWDNLGEEQRQQALDARSAQQLPEWMATSLSRGGVRVAGAYFASTQQGPDGFLMPKDVRDFLDRQ